MTPEDEARRIELRDALAQTLMASFHGHPIQRRDVWAGFWSVADECIRLMRWAQTLQPSLTERIEIDQNEFPGMRGLRILGPAPLTMPPPEWVPGSSMYDVHFGKDKQ